MISINKEKLEAVLKQVILKGYTWIEDKENVYLAIHEISVDYALDDTGETYYVVGDYGYDGDSGKQFNRSFNMLLDTNWSWDFIAGYFTAYTTLMEEKEQYDTRRH